MGQQFINLGVVANDGTGTKWRAGGDVINENFTELYGLIGSIDFVFVAQESDFPVQDATTITLEAGQVYVVSGSFSVAKRFVCETGSSMSAFNTLGTVLTYTGSGTMFTGVDANFTINKIALNAPSAALFNFSDVAILNSHVVIIQDISVITALKTGTFTSLASIVVQDSGAFDVDDGITIAGTGWRVWRFQSFGQASTSASFTGFDFGAATCGIVTIQSLLLNAPTGATGISGAASSANILLGSLGTITDCNFLGGITPLSGLTSNDIRWYFQLNNAIQDTMPDAMAALNSNVTETVIASPATPVLVAGTFTIERDSQFTVTAAGRVTYNGERDITAPIDIVTSIESASGTNKDIKVFLALNGSVITNSAKSNRVGSSDPKNTTVIWQLTLSQNDYLEIWTENTSDTINLVVIDAVLRVL